MIFKEYFCVRYNNIGIKYAKCKNIKVHETGCIVDSIVIIIVDPIKAHHATCYIATSGEISS